MKLNLVMGNIVKLNLAMGNIVKPCFSVGKYRETLFYIIVKLKFS